jgi:hypothetical protein
LPIRDVNREHRNQRCERTRCSFDDGLNVQCDA